MLCKPPEKVLVASVACIGFHLTDVTDCANHLKSLLIREWFCQLITMLLASFYHDYGKALPTRRQSLAKKVAKPCQLVGRKKESGEENLSLIELFSQKESLSLSCIGSLPSSGKAIKRESGVNPEQSRCCKFRTMLQAITLYATGTLFREGVYNRNKSEDLPCTFYHCFRGKSVESNEPGKSSIISFIKPYSEKVKKVINSAKFI